MVIYLLVKFGAPEHLEMLQKEGSFYCKDIKYFVDHEDGKVRGDEFEAVTQIDFIGDAVIKLRPYEKPNDEWVELKSNNVLMKENSKDPLGNLFCMSSFRMEVEPEPRIYSFDKRFKGFGTHYLIITHTGIFEQRIKEKLNELKLKYKFSPVNYLDLKTYTGKKTLFQKHIEYEWQEELRLYIETDMNKPFQFSIGNIEDISTIYNLEEVPKIWVKAH